MTRPLVVFEDAHWSDLRPLSELIPVPALAFGGSCLAERWRRGLVGHAGAGGLLSIEARTGALGAWGEAARPSTGRPAERDDVIVVNAAALPGPWLEAVLEGGPATLFRTRTSSSHRVTAARVPMARLAPGLGRGADFESFLVGLGLVEADVEAPFLEWPWDLVERNSEALVADLSAPGKVRGEVDRLAAVLEPERVTVEVGARVDAYAVLDARRGPIHLGPGVQVSPHAVVVGPCAVGAATELLGGVIGNSTIGPQCRIAGEVDTSVWQGYANKRHHGFIGHSVVGEWANLGALTTTSDLKNNYGPVRVEVGVRVLDSGLTKLGSMLGAGVKTGIGTLLPTGAWIGTGANLFGGGQFAPKYLPPFAWWDGQRTTTYDLERFIATARVAMGRRERSLSAPLEAALRTLFATSVAERARDQENHR